MWKVIVGVGLFVFLAILRLHNYDRLPFPVHAEELLYSWSGISLLEKGVPISWSTLNYPQKNLYFDGTIGDKNGMFYSAKFYKPNFDEPPLYSLIVGAVAKNYGDSMDKVPAPSHTRIPSVLASLVTLLLVFLVGWKWWDYKTGILAMLFYGVTPIFVFGSRLSVPENMIAMGVIGALLLTKYYLHKPQVWMAAVFGLLAVALGLMKPTGYFLAPLMIFLTVYKKRYKDAVIILVLTLVGVGGYFAYGAHYDWKLFLDIVSLQGQRFAGWSGLGHVLMTPAYDIFIQYDGWYVFAMISALFFALKKDKSINLTVLTLFFFYWLMVAVFSGTEQDLLPWYRYPIFPLLAVYGGLGLKWVYDNVNFFGVALVVGTLLSSRFFLHNAFRPQTPTIVFRLTYLLALIPALVGFIWNKSIFTKLSKGILIGVIVLGVYFNSKYIYSAFEVNCESQSCLFGPSTKLSEIRMPFIWRWLVMGDAHGVLDDKKPWF